jgi:hypothetical protein
MMRIVVVIVMIANNRYPRDEDTSMALFGSWVLS